MIHQEFCGEYPTGPGCHHYEDHYDDGSYATDYDDGSYATDYDDGSYATDYDDGFYSDATTGNFTAADNFTDSTDATGSFTDFANMNLAQLHSRLHSTKSVGERKALPQ